MMVSHSKSHHGNRAGRAMKAPQSKRHSATLVPKSVQSSPAELVALRLFVAGSGSKSMQAIANIKHICETYLKDFYQLEVIDLYQQPERAKSDQIVAIPTLIKDFPLPQCRIIGDLSNAAEVCASLNITSTNCHSDSH